MRDFHKHDGEEADFEAGGSFSQGFETLSKCLKAAFALLVAAIACMAVWFFTYGGLIRVDPQEAVILLRFGKLQEVYTSGWHWALPYPVNSVVRVPVKSLSLNVGDAFMPSDKSLVMERKPGSEMMSNPDAPLVPGKDGYLITGDANIIHTEWSVQYRIVDPKLYFESFLTPSDMAGEDGAWIDPRSGKPLGERGPRTMLRDLFINSVIETTSTWKASDILRSNSVKSYNAAVEEAFKKRISELGCGLTIDGVYLTRKSPPPQTIAAFADVISAEQEGSKEKEIAKAYAIEQRAAGEEAKSRTLAEAVAYKRRIVADVAASESVFKEILAQYKASPDSVTVALYSSALSDALEQVKDKFVIKRNGASGQELRLKLNPEPPSTQKKDEKRDSK